MGEEDQELRALMIRYQGGSREAFQEIYAQLAPGVRRYLLHLAAGSEIADDLLHSGAGFVGDGKGATGLGRLREHRRGNQQDGHQARGEEGAHGTH